MEAIEQRAAQVLAGVPAHIWDGESLPVPVEAIADSHFGILVRDVDDLTTAPGAPLLTAGQSLSGLLLPSRAEIWVNASEAVQWPPRRRFTIGHELGHWCLHRQVGGGVFCRSTELDPASGEVNDPPEPEVEANAFAAALLMPAELIRHHYLATGRNFERLCEIFAASNSAMGRRLHAVIPREA